MLRNTIVHKYDAKIKKKSFNFSGANSPEVQAPKILRLILMVCNRPLIQDQEYLEIQNSFRDIATGYDCF